MSSLPKLTVVSLVVIALGALQFAVPASTGKQTTPAISRAIGSLSQQHKPWPWADTHPDAELIIKDKSGYMLAAASGRKLAFAPSHLSSTPAPGKKGSSVIIGQRDTQFNSVLPNPTHRYIVRAITI